MYSGVNVFEDISIIFPVQTNNEYEELLGRAQQTEWNIQISFCR